MRQGMPSEALRGSFQIRIQIGGRVKGHPCTINPVEQERVFVAFFGAARNRQQLFWRDRIVVTKANRTCCAINARIFLKPEMDANREIAAYLALSPFSST
jgi:hypothetical protein